MPVSIEQEEGPKKVNTVLLLMTIAVSNFPQAIVFSILKLHDQRSFELFELQKVQIGKLKTGDDGLCVVSIGGGGFPPS